MTNTDSFNLERFVAAQTPVFATVLNELRAGRKRTHWMWFVFPQLRGLGRVKARICWKRVFGKACLIG